MVESNENKSRIDKHATDYEIAFGNQKKIIIDDLSRLYPETYGAMKIVNLAIARKILRKLSRCYSAGCIREVIEVKTGEKNQVLTDLFNVIYALADENGNDFNMVMQKANEYYTNNRYVEVFCYQDNSNLIRFKSMPQYLFTSVPNNTKTMAEVIVFKQDKADFTEIEKFIDWGEQSIDRDNAEVIGIYTFWSKTDNFTIVNMRTRQMDAKGAFQGEIFTPVFVKNDSNKDKKNPWGVMPFAPVKEITEGFFYPYGSEIAEMSKEINLILCDIITIAAQQGFGQAVIYFDGDQPPAITKTGPTNVINIPNKTGNSKFEFANANPDLPGHMGVCLSLVRMLLTTNDLTTDKVSGELSATNFASAIDRLIADSETVENIEDQRKKYIVAENNIFKIVIAILKYMMESNTWPSEYPKVSKELLDTVKFKLKLSFNSIKPLTTEKERAETISLLEEKGFIYPYEKYMRFFEGMTEKEAKERMDEIEKIRKERAKSILEDNARGGINQENRPDGTGQKDKIENGDTQDIE